MTASEKLTAFSTIVLKEVRRFLRIWIQTVLPAAMTTVLYFVIFGNLIGERIGAMSGVAYIDYIVPGLILMSVLTNSYANVVSSFFGARFHRNIEEMLVSPVPNYIILAGFVCGGVARGMTVGLAVTLVAVFFTNIQIHNILVVVSMVLLTSILFSLGGFINAIYARNFDDISIVPTFVLTPLTYLGGVFYSIDLLPEFWRTASLFNPILYMVNAFRYGFLGISDMGLVYSYGITLFFILLLTVFCLRLMDKGRGIRT
ncbi:MAG: ABC transporter permease [Gammaproteobacteria bacterium]|nr:ABC transporter permease [Gammaproteobacteria bacterium]MDH5802862.1 ABC transporter permease [Gammaproteobacteria bacterium]